MEKEGKTCRLIIKVCRPDDECEYACGVDERRTRARLFVEGRLFIALTFNKNKRCFFFDSSCIVLLCRDPGRDHQTAEGHVRASRL